MALDLRLARRVVAQDPSAAGPLLERLGEELASASAELRELARGIHPAVLTERGLAPAIGALAARSTVPVEVLDVPEDRLAPALEATAYFTVSEALTNVAKYAEATHATVLVERRDGELVVEVRDDGIGGASPDSGSGLRGLADRVGAADGTLSVDSPRGEGTLVRAVLPLA
jgi:signal transduction histidine kinase